MKKTLFICIAVIIGFTTYAQDSTNTDFIARPNTNTYIWSIAPQFTAEHAMRIDLEKRLKNGSSVILAPRQVANGRFFHVIQVDVEWVWDETLGVSTMIGSDKEKHTGVHKFGPDLAIGLEMEPIERFIIDMYAGVGARYSFVAYGDKEFINTHSSIFDIGYTGIVPLIVLKVGVVF
jgi:hypothetical protein